MKKILAFMLVSVAIVSCYEDYILDFEYTGVYFPYQIDVRTFVVGEGMKIEVGAALGGVRKNTIDRDVSFILDNNLITAGVLAKMKSAQNYINEATKPLTALLPMPSNYYTLSNMNTIVIKAGQHMGAVVVRPDSVNFLNDSINTMYATYVLSFYINEADADTILESKRTNIVGLKFENMLYGNYWHGGMATIERSSLPDSTFTYYKMIPVPESKIRQLKTVGPSTLSLNGYLNQTSLHAEMMLVLKGTKVYVSSAQGSTFTFKPDGESTFNRSKLLQDRKIFLKYKYTDPGTGYTFHCIDTMYFRNRIRDGINEWQDENPLHYEK
jgi:hypothetical protein